MNNQWKVPLWKDILLTLAGLVGLGHETLDVNGPETGLVLVFAGMLGLGVPGLYDRFKGGKGGGVE